MSARNARRRAAGRGGPAPELVAILIVVVLYGVTLALGPAVAGGSSPTPTEAPVPSSAASASPSVNPLRSDITALIEFNARLTLAREELREILARSPFRGSEVAFVLRKINVTLLPGAERASRLALDLASKEVGAQLEILYASAGATIERASDLALGSGPAYRRAAQEIVVLFTDLPAIDEQLKALLQPAASPTPSLASPSSSPGSSGSLPSPSPGVPSPSPGERLQDPGFETGIGPWRLRTAGLGVAATVRPGARLGLAGTRSLQVDLPASASPGDVGVGQGSIDLDTGRRYAVAVSIRSNIERTAQLRVVGPMEESFAITIVEIGPATVVASLEFVASLDEPSATFWIDLGGSTTAGTVWLDDASFIQQAPA